MAHLPYMDYTVTVTLYGLKCLMILMDVSCCCCFLLLKIVILLVSLAAVTSGDIAALLHSRTGDILSPEV